MINSNPSDFSYDVFDRQLKNFISMSHVLIDGWDDSTTTEMNCDINSLCIKAARLCYMADIDMSIQREDLNQHRQEQNRFYHNLFNQLICKFVPFMKAVIDKVKGGQPIQGHSSPLFPFSLSKVLPNISEILQEEGMSVSNLETMQKDVEIVEKMLDKNGRAKFPGVRPDERLMLLLQNFALLCYLLQHFTKVSKLHQTEITPEEASRLFTKDILLYTESMEGREELERFRTSLEFDYDGEVLTEIQLKEVRRKIRDNIPVSLQTAFMKYANQTDLLVNEILNMGISTEDYTLLVAGMAKWQTLKAMEYEQTHEVECIPVLHNVIFRNIVSGSKVNLIYVREVISRMLPLITRKNHWFCVWCVLKHRNLLAVLGHEAFAMQMQHHDWFPNLESFKTFSGATLNDYNGYLSQTDFLVWKEKDYEEYLSFHNAPKQSKGLLQKFKTLCLQMDAAFSAR